MVLSAHNTEIYILFADIVFYSKFESMLEY
jgi:hypothetical protein